MPPAGFTLDLTIPAIAELAALGPRFVAWRWESRNGKPTKPPLRAVGKGYADSSDPATWCTIEAALAAARDRRLPGIGLVFDAARDGIGGVDLDGCRDPETGAIEPWARRIIRAFDSYTEISPSGTGVKILFRADPVTDPLRNRRVVRKANGSGKDAAVEAYTRGRYFCLTGRHLDGTPDEITSATEAFEQLAAWLAETPGSDGPDADRQDGRDADAGRTRANGPAGDSPFAAVNEAAMRRLGAWVPDLFPAARRSPKGVWRVKSRDLGRDLEEDLSIAPSGIVDFGVADQGDPRQGKRTPIDLVIEWGDAKDAKEAAGWLAGRLGMGGFGSFGSDSTQGCQDSSAAGPDPADWPEPEPLPGPPPVEAFEDLLLPPSLRPWVRDIADRMQCPPDFVAAPALVALGSVVGRQIGIRPKRKDDWLVVPNLWGAVVGPPGVLKTPALQEALRPLLKLEMGAKASHEAELKRHEAEKKVAAAAKKNAEKDLQSRLRKGDDRATLVEELLAKDDEGEEPARRRFVVNDSTVEKLGEILKANPNGVLQFRDELTGWLRGLEREGREGDRAFFLEAWNGTGRFTYDRIVRGTIDIEAACVSMLGGIQPGPLAAYLGAIKAGGVADDGLLQRFQLTVWPDVSPEWRNVDEWPDGEAGKRAFGSFGSLASLECRKFSAEDPPASPVPFARFGPDAQPVFDAWRAGLETRLRSGDLHPAFEAHLSKYRSLVPSLALIFHLLEAEEGPVSEAACVRAIAWAAYLESHAARLYHVLLRGDTAAAVAIADKIRAGAVPDGFTLREVHRPKWARLTDKDAIQAALDLLEEHGWIRAGSETTGGRPKRVYTINPKLKEAGP